MGSTIKAGLTSNSITYPRSKAAFTLVSFVTGYFYGVACTLLTQTLPVIISANLRDGNTSVLPLFFPLGLLTQDPSQTEDFVWAMVFSIGGNVSMALRCGDYSEVTKLYGTGAFKLRIPLTGPGGQISATLRRDGADVVSLVPPGFVFSPYPTSYNFNAFVASSR